jgi:hypothetical protein
MNLVTEHQDSRQRNEEIQAEVAVERPAAMTLAEREARPYVVRDLSWELARYLDAESFPASASAPSNSASGRHGRTREEGRVAH